MKKIVIFSISALITSLSILACEFTITNDPQAGYKEVYIAFNSNLANVVNRQTLATSPGIEQEEDTKKEIKKNNFIIKKGSRGTTPFTKWFDVFIPLKATDEFQRLYRVQMHYCSKDNAMTITQIKNGEINKDRFTIINYLKPDQAIKAHQHCPAHATGHESQEKYEKNLQLSNPSVHQPEVLIYPLGDKELLP